LKTGILEPRDFSPEAISLLRRVGDVELYDDISPVGHFVSDKAALFVRLGHIIDARMLAEAQNLSAIVSPTTALNHIDLDAAAKVGAAVLSLRGETEFLRTVTATPEHALGLVIAVLRNYRHAFLGTGEQPWNRDALRGTNVAGIRIGIIGFGRVGQWLAHVLAVMDAHIAFEDTDPDCPSLPCAQRLSTKEALIAASDVIVLAASYTNGQQPILTRPLLELMRDKHLVNIARGELIDEAALVPLIAAGHFAGVALDVIEGETTGNTRLDKLRELTATRNLIVTPHIGGATLQSMHATETFMARKLLAHMGQHPS
jgi:D-3-phosphoglycerate dehydrogenase